MAKPETFETDDMKTAIEICENGIDQHICLCKWQQIQSYEYIGNN
jgi:hypothetical protein